MILERDPLKVDPSGIGTIKVLATIKEGRPIFQLGVDRLDRTAVNSASQVAPNPKLLHHGHGH